MFGVDTYCMLSCYSTRVPTYPCEIYGIANHKRRIILDNRNGLSQHRFNVQYTTQLPSRFYERAPACLAGDYCKKKGIL